MDLPVKSSTSLFHSELDDNKSSLSLLSSCLLRCRPATTSKDNTSPHSLPFDSCVCVCSFFYSSPALASEWKTGRTMRQRRAIEKREEKTELASQLTSGYTRLCQPFSSSSSSSGGPWSCTQNLSDSPQSLLSLSLLYSCANQTIASFF